MPDFIKVAKEEIIPIDRDYLVKFANSWHIGAFRTNEHGKIVFQSQTFSMGMDDLKEIYTIIE